jgi:hypothetical protein
MGILRSAGRHFGAAAIGLAVVAGLAGAAAAQEAQCQWQGPLLTLTDMVLTQRSDLPRLQARRFGAEAAYLKIRYSHPDELAVVTMLDRLVSEGAHQAADLRLAWYLATYGAEATLAKLGDPAFDILKSSTNLSAIRAIMSAGWDVRLLQRISELPADEQAGLIQAVITAIIDAPDDYKGRLVATALQVNLISLAVGLTASTQDRKSWKTFAASAPQDDAFRSVVNSWRWLPAIMGNPPLTDPTLDAERQAARAKIHEVTIAAALEPEIDLLSLYLNQSGETDVAVTVANDFRRAVDAGVISPRDTLDAAWLFIFGDLASQTSAEHVHDVLGSASTNIGRYGIDRVSDLVDRIVAVDALTGYLTGQTDELPNEPVDLSADFAGQWPHWLELAQQVRAGADLSTADAADLDIIAELLFTARQVDALGDLLAAAPVSLETITTAGDFARRLDRQCNSYLFHKGEAVLLSGQSIFKFD